MSALTREMLSRALTATTFAIWFHRLTDVGVFVTQMAIRCESLSGNYSSMEVGLMHIILGILQVTNLFPPIVSHATQGWALIINTGMCLIRGGQRTYRGYTKARVAFVALDGEDINCGIQMFEEGCTWWLLIFLAGVGAGNVYTDLKVLCLFNATAIAILCTIDYFQPHQIN
jgi:hypothetical protein